jgi:hypothetical protein
MSPQNVLALQRTVGNGAVSRVLARPRSRTTVQRVLNQDDMQKKLVSVVESIRRVRHPGAPAPDPVTQTWYAQLIQNGLCGGWAEINLHYPEWISSVWRCMSEWEPPTVATPGNTVKSLNESLWKNTENPVAEAPGEALDLVLLLRRVWETMDRREPTAGYGPVPGWVSGIHGDVSTLDIDIENREKKLPSSQERELEVGREGAGQEVAKMTGKMMGLSGGNFPKKDFVYRARIETDEHVMSVVARRDKGRLLISVSETEQAGIVQCGDWGEVASVLDGGIFLPTENRNKVPVTITVFG